MSKNSSSKTESSEEKKSSSDSKISSTDVKSSKDSPDLKTASKEAKDLKTPSKDSTESKKSTDSTTALEKSKSKMSSQTSTDDDKTSRGMGGSLRMNSTDIRTLTKESQTANQSTGGLIPAGGAPPGESVYDTIAYIIRCKHNKMAVFRADKDRISWLPFIAAAPNKTWNDSSVDGISIIFNKQDAELDAKLGTKIAIKERRCLHVFRTQIPSKQRFISLVIFYVLLEDASVCCKDEKRIKWMQMQEVKKGNIENVWGPEPEDYAQDKKLSSKRAKNTGITEQSYDKIKELLPKGKAKNEEQMMISEAGIGEPELDKLYDDYIEHCFPSVTMSFFSFKDYLSKYMDCDKNDAKFLFLFKAFNSKETNCLNFYEFVSGLAALETKADKCGPRLQFIFRYYGEDRKMTLNQYQKLVKDCNIGSLGASIEAKASDAWKRLGANDAIDYQKFKQGVESGVIKGLSGLCKAKILGQITKSTTNRIEKKSAVKKKAGFLMQNRRNKGLCLACRGKKYEYGLHAIKLDTNGRCVEPRRIFDRKLTTAWEECWDSTLISAESTNEMNRQKYSIDYTFNTRSIAHTVKDLIRGFSHKKETKGFLSNDIDTLIKYLEVLGRDVEDFFSGEDRIIKVNSPSFVFGDINGNLDQLLKFERLLFHSFPILSGHYIFLGNYSGQDKWGVECTAYLFALKLIAPTKIILLRGNQEIGKGKKQDNKKDNKKDLYTECVNKYDKSGKKIYELLNKMFDKMPICAVIDEKIFCGHSGVPVGVNKESQISAIPNNLKEPEKSTVAWQVCARSGASI